MNNKLLLDTCALIWYLGNFSMNKMAIQTIQKQAVKGNVYINPASAWEVSMLIEKGRLSLSLPIDIWFQRAQLATGFKLAKIPISVLIHAPQLPGSPPNDPVDSLMIAIARQQGMTLVTRDSEILRYGAQGYVHVLKC